MNNVTIGAIKDELDRQKSIISGGNRSLKDRAFGLLELRKLEKQEGSQKMGLSLLLKNMAIGCIAKESRKEGKSYLDLSRLTRLDMIKPFILIV